MWVTGLVQEAASIGVKESVPARESGDLAYCLHIHTHALTHPRERAMYIFCPPVFQTITHSLTLRDAQPLHWR